MESPGKQMRRRAGIRAWVHACSFQWSFFCKIVLLVVLVVGGRSTPPPREGFRGAVRPVLWSCRVASQRVPRCSISCMYLYLENPTAGVGAPMRSADRGGRVVKGSAAPFPYVCCAFSIPSAVPIAPDSSIRGRILVNRNLFLKRQRRSRISSPRFPVTCFFGASKRRPTLRETACQTSAGRCRRPRWASTRKSQRRQTLKR